MVFGPCFFLCLTRTLTLEDDGFFGRSAADRLLPLLLSLSDMSSSMALCDGNIEWALFNFSFFCLRATELLVGGRGLDIPMVVVDVVVVDLGVLGVMAIIFTPLAEFGVDCKAGRELTTLTLCTPALPSPPLPVGTAKLGARSILGGLGSLF